MRRAAGAPTGALAGALAALVAFVGLAVAVGGDRGAVVDADRDVADSLHELATDHPLLADASRVVTDLGASPALYTIVAIVAVAALARRRPRLAVYVAAAAVGSGALNRAAKAIVGRDRPYFPDPLTHSGGHSYPSGHAMNSAAVLGAVVVVAAVLVRGARRRPALAATAAAAGVVVAAIGFTRLALGVHFLSDVVGGWLLAAAWLGTVTTAAGVWPRAPDA